MFFMLQCHLCSAVHLLYNFFGVFYSNHKLFLFQRASAGTANNRGSLVQNSKCGLESSSNECNNSHACIHVALFYASPFKCDEEGTGSKSEAASKHEGKFINYHMMHFVPRQHPQ